MVENSFIIQYLTYFSDVTFILFSFNWCALKNKIIKSGLNNNKTNSRCSRHMLTIVWILSGQAGHVC